MQDTIQMADGISIARFEPAPPIFRQLAQEGFLAIISLQAPEENQRLSPQEERRLAEQAGLSFYHQAVTRDTLSDEAVDLFRTALDALPRPVLLHCASGKRSGALAMMHLASEQGLSGRQALKRAEEMGVECGPPELQAFVRSYVDRH